MNIAFVTRELGGLGRSGGIGSAVRHACEHFVRRGHETHVYYTGAPRLGEARCRKELARIGVTLRAKPLARNLTRDCEKRSRASCAMLRSTRHDVYIFHEFAADAFFCFQAREKEGCFAGSVLGMVTHGSSLWADEANGFTTPDARRLRLYAMERACCERADFLVSPSAYLLDWMRGCGWILPETSQRIANFNAPPDREGETGGRRNERLAAEAIREIVFFGRLEERKGVRVFCDALNMLPEQATAGRTVVFLGGEDHFSARAVRSLLRPLLARGNVAVRFLTRCDSARALAFLRREGVLAVMPSLRENSPCAVGECLAHGIAFIASSVGGAKELIREEDLESALCPPRKEDLARRLDAALRGEGIAAARPAQNANALYEAWDRLLAAVSPSFCGTTEARR